MSTTETEGGHVSQYVPFTPFQESYAFEPQPSTLALLERVEPQLVVTPFVSEYAGTETQTPQSQELRDMLFELYDEEFNEVLAELADEAWEAASQRAEPFGETGTTVAAEQFLQEWSEPVRQAAEQMLDTIAQAASQHDVASMSESEVDRFFEQFEPSGTGLEPHFEKFLGGLWKKAKAFAKTAVAVAKKGLTLIPGLDFLIGRLKVLVRPLLLKVLRSAIDKLPPNLQPYAKQLAERVLGVTTEAEDEGLEAAPTAPDLSIVQHEFDLEAATLAFASSEAEQEAVIGEATAAADREDGSDVARLREARARFVDELESGVDPEQAMEQFIPAIMAVLPLARTVIGAIGRGRVVSTLAKFLAGFVSRYVPPEAATQLSSAIVDAGLRMLSLETPGELEAPGPRIACEAIAQTVEDTVRRVGELEATTFEEPALFEAAVTQAFHDAAAENFPPQVIVPELHESTVHATWVAMPRRKRHKLYKRYTHVFDVEITPQMAESITTFRGTKLAAVLKDQLGVTPPVRARVHLYQAIHGTTLRRIASLERHVPGLGMTRHGARQLHPLTVQAAGILLQHPKLGRDVPGKFLSTRNLIAAGERFYYLEIAGSRPLTVARAVTGGVPVRRTSDVNVTLDFPKDEFRVFVYLSESESQQVAAKIRQHDLTAVLLLARRIYDDGLRVAFDGDIHRHVKVVTETVSQEQLFGGVLRKLAGHVRGYVAKRVVEWVSKAVADYLKAGAGEFVAAADDPADGVTIVIRIVHPPGAALVRKLLRGEAPPLSALGDLAKHFAGEPQVSAKAVAGYRFD